MWSIEQFFPNWQKGAIHESSPGARGASVRLAKECPNYIPSQFFCGVQGGTEVDGVRCENLEKLSFPNDSIDLHVTQDVFEHVFDPEAAFREIAHLADIGAFEVNEAFASVVLAWQAETGADLAKVNINGGAIALGHPLGGSGARLMTTLVHHMRDNGIRYGLQTMCEGGGMANATIIERLG